MLAEIYGPWSFLMVLIPLGICLLTLLSIPINAKWGRRRWWGLGISLMLIISGGIILFYFLPARDVGDPRYPGFFHVLVENAFFYIMISIPFLCGLCSLFLWFRPRE